MRQVPAERIVEVRTQAEDAGLEVVGLHWLLAKTEGFYLTSPDPTVRRRTADYLRALAEVCADLGGKIMVLGSPKQRNLLPGVSYDDAEAYAVEVLHAAIAGVHAVRRDDRRSSRSGRPRRLHAHRRSPAFGWPKMVDSPHCKLHLDVKAMRAKDSRSPTSSATAASGWSTSTPTTRTCSAPAWATSTSGRSSPRSKRSTTTAG